MCHARESGHAAFACNYPGCKEIFVNCRERDAHQRDPHVLGHVLIKTNAPHECIHCQKSFRSKAELLRHANKEQHQPYACECGATFSRLDVLYRHLESFGSGTPKYPCHYCKRHRGANGFKRADHLKQHMRNYHHHDFEDADKNTWSFPVCSHPECPQYRDEKFKKLHHSAQMKDKPFNKQSDYTKHMREEHNECEFPCDISGCARVGRCGYFRRKDMMKHRKEQHPDAGPYQVKGRETRFSCTEQGCGASFYDTAGLKYHSYCRHIRYFQTAK